MQILNVEKFLKLSVNDDFFKSIVIKKHFSSKLQILNAEKFPLCSGKMTPNDDEVFPQIGAPAFLPSFQLNSV